MTQNPSWAWEDKAKAGETYREAGSVLAHYLVFPQAAKREAVDHAMRVFGYEGAEDIWFGAPRPAPTQEEESK